MTNSADQLIYKAAMLLEEQQDVEGALEALHDALVLAQIANHPVQLIRAKTVLGELLVQIDQPGEAIKEFRDIVRIAEAFDGDQAEISEEVESARDWLKKLDTGH
jgi:tetratricopeptide (TPR) repeat protein